MHDWTQQQSSHNKHFRQARTFLFHCYSRAVISQPYQSHQESCCYFPLQNLNIPTIVNTSSNFDYSSQQHS
jgi:hypothetical protein